MRIIHAVEWKCSSAGIVLIRPVTPTILYYAISLQKVVLMKENRKEGLIEIMVHPLEDVVAVVAVVDAAAAVLVSTLGRVTKTMTNPPLNHHVRMAAVIT